MKSSKYFILAALLLLTVGCQPFGENTKAQSSTTEQVTDKTFQEVLTHTQSTPLSGQVLAEMKGSYNPELFRYGFVSSDGYPIFVYEENDGTTNVAIASKDGTVKQESFPGYKLDEVYLNQKILYIGYKDDKAIKLNVDSFHYSEVDKGELNQARNDEVEFKLPGKETAVYTQGGFIYTKEGYIFDIKNHEYLLNSNNEKKKFYEKADIAFGSYLFEIQPRLDQAINLIAIKASGDKTETGKSYAVHLDLPKGYDVSNMEHAITTDGKLILFAIGVEEQNKQVIKTFRVPLDSFQEQK